MSLFTAPGRPRCRSGPPGSENPAQSLAHDPASHGHPGSPSGTSLPPVTADSYQPYFFFDCSHSSMFRSFLIVAKGGDVGKLRTADQESVAVGSQHNGIRHIDSCAVRTAAILRV